MSANLTGIKITQLSDIGGNISPTSLIPIVNTSNLSNPITDKANLQIVGNLILNGAGGSYFPPASQAILAQTVTNAAQPNITSVGILSSLSVTDVSVLTIPGGYDGYFLQTNGEGVVSWSAVGGGGGNGVPGGANTQVQFNNDGVFAGTNGLTFNQTTNTFSVTGNLNAGGNAVINGPLIAVGAGASELAANLANPTLVISDNGNAYVQAAINNVSDIGSADWVAYGHHGNDAAGWVDMGFASSFFNDPNYTITGPGDGYVIVQGYLPGQAPAVGGGNLILATGDTGTTQDIIFGTNGFLTANIFGRISNSNNSLELSRANSSINLVGGGNIVGANVITANIINAEVTFNGSGSGLTGLNANNITTGVLPRPQAPVLAVRTVSSNTTALPTDNILIVDSTSTITLPAASSMIGVTLYIQNANVGVTITVLATNPDLINGNSNVVITNQYSLFGFVSIGTSWIII